MKKIQVVIAGSAVLASLLLTGCNSKTVSQEQYSGFLSSYEGLVATKSASGQKVLRWEAPGFNVANYDKLIYQPVRFHPAPRPSDRISEQTYAELLRYANTRLSEAFASRFKLVGFSSGAGTLEFRGAITGVAASTEGLKPYEVVPVALVFAGAMAAAGERDQNSELYLEGEFIDTATGKTVMRVVRKGMGKTLSNDKQAVTFADLQTVIDDLTTDVLKFH